MRRMGWILLGGLFGMFLLGAADVQQKIHFPMHGFSISPLESPPGGPDGAILTMCLPPSDGYAPSVSVLSQKSPGTIDDCIATSKKWMEKNGLKVINVTKLDDNTATFLFAGKVNGKSLHAYARASRKGDQVMLIVAIATEDQWKTDAAQMQNCVDSFQRD
jgi:hypothetical protein